MFQMIILETLSTISAVNSELENFSHRTHDAVGDFYLFVQIIEKSLSRLLPPMNAVSEVKFVDLRFYPSENVF